MDIEIYSRNMWMKLAVYHSMIQFSPPLRVRTTVGICKLGRQCTCGVRNVISYICMSDSSLRFFHSFNRQLFDAIISKRQDRRTQSFRLKRNSYICRNLRERISPVLCVVCRGTDASPNIPTWKPSRSVHTQPRCSVCATLSAPTTRLHTLSERPAYRVHHVLPADS